MDRNQEVMVALSEPVIKRTCCASWRRNHAEVISGLQKNLVISETMHPRQKVTVEHFYEVLVAEYF